MMIAKIFIKVINYRGIINIGGRTQTIYQFAKVINLLKELNQRKLKKYLYEFNEIKKIN